MMSLSILLSMSYHTVRYTSDRLEYFFYNLLSHDNVVLSSSAIGISGTWLDDVNQNYINITGYRFISSNRVDISVVEAQAFICVTLLLLISCLICMFLTLIVSFLTLIWLSFSGNRKSAWKKSYRWYNLSSSKSKLAWIHGIFSAFNWTSNQGQKAKLYYSVQFCRKSLEVDEFQWVSHKRLLKVLIF